MLGNRDFKIEVVNDSIVIENLTNNYYENCLISLTDIFYLDLIHHTCDFKVGEIKTLNLLTHSFYENVKNEVYNLKIYSNHKLVFDKKVGDKSKCYVVFSNEKFQPVVEQLIIGLDRYSKEKIYHYSINYDSNLNYYNLTNKRMDVEGDMSDGQFMQFLKPRIFLDILEMGYNGVVFLDADIQIKPNIDETFNYLSEIEDGPIFQKGAWNYTVVNGEYIPGPLLTKAMDLPKQKYPQCITNIVIFNKSHKNLFKEWDNVCQSDEINSIRKIEFMHDELILNCLMWKLSIKPKSFWFFVNVLTLRDVKFFYNHVNSDYLSFDNGVCLLDMNTYGYGHTSQSFIPYDKNEVVGFHCVKEIGVANDINDFILSNERGDFESKLLYFYDNIEKSDRVLNEDYKNFNIINHYIDGPVVEIVSSEENEFLVEFFNSKNICEYRTTIKSNMWTKLNKKYFHEWRCVVYLNGEKVYDEICNPRGKRIYISLDSSSLGDTLAWFPYVEEFRRKWNCEMICSTFMNNLFKEKYPNIEFVEPGASVKNLYGMYTIGWYYGEDGTFSKEKNPNDFKQIPLGKTATDILGLDFEYVKSNIGPERVKIEKKKRVGIGFHSTAQTKYWNNPNGWQELVDYLNTQGYEVMILSKEGDGYMGNFYPNGVVKLPEGSIENLIDTMLSCEFFIGIGSGLSWLAWSLNIPIVLISGFSTPISEFEGDDVIRIFNNSVCNGCFNRHKFDPGDWNWCPDYKGTERQFECTKSITGKMIIDSIENRGWIKPTSIDKFPHTSWIYG
jgi:autotransporter strand-loop-strand O-heptosyltransferase